MNSWFFGSYIEFIVLDYHDEFMILLDYEINPTPYTLYPLKGPVYQC
jgi:hypothetical protein